MKRFSIMLLYKKFETTIKKYYPFSKLKRHPMQKIRTIDELDKMLLKLDDAETDDDLRQLFSTFSMEINNQVPKDPYSNEYAKMQFDLYQRISGKVYSVKNEKSEFNIQSAVTRPFPFSTGSSKTVGDQLIAIGHIIKTMDLKPGARIIEFGPGWGNTTIALAMMGFDVTAVDIENNFCDLLKRRAENENVDITIINSDFSWIEQIDDPVDAILFFESFHHASNHIRIIKAMKNAVKNDGKILFAGEPITTDFPIPWGLRLDGESLRAIRKFGWLELGFSEDYFVETLGKFGLTVEKLTLGSSPWGTIYKATNSKGNLKKYFVTDKKIHSQIGSLNNENSLVANGLAGFLIYGPYLYLPAGKYTANFYLSNTTSFIGRGYVDVSCRKGEMILAKRDINFKNFRGKEKIQINFYSEKDETDIEMRLYCNNMAIVSINSVEIIIDK